jgi:hypothetical protein
MAHVQGGDCFCLRYLLSHESWRITLTQKTMEMDFCVVFCDIVERFFLRWSTLGKLKVLLDRGGPKPRPLVCKSFSSTELRGQVGSSKKYFGTQSYACILKAHSHSHPMSGGSIWASLECQCCFWIAGELVSYLTMWLLALQLFKNCINTQGKLRLNLHSLSVSELLEYRHL